MTDNEIFETEIKCINRRANGKCNGGTDCCKCDLLMDEKDIISAYERAIANSNLINRQQTEIDELKHERKVLIDDIHCSADKNNEQLEEIEKLERTISYLEGVCESTADKVRAEAYKEFAERLKNEIISETAYGCDSNQHTGYYDYQIKIGNIPEYIDNLVKEMVGE